MKLKKNVPLAKEEKRKERKTWPLLAEMKVGHVLEIEDKSEWPSASKYAHVLAARKGWRITTTWIDEENIGRIRRLK